MGIRKELCAFGSPLQKTQILRLKELRTQSLKIGTHTLFPCILPPLCQHQSIAFLVSSRAHEPRYRVATAKDSKNKVSH